MSVAPGELMPDRQSNQVLTFPLTPTSRILAVDQYKTCQFHSVELFELDDRFEPAYHYGRIIKQEEDRYTADFNHPLSGFDLRLEMEIIRVKQIQSTDVINNTFDDFDAILNRGPGMQNPLHFLPQDYIDDSAFERIDSGNDTEYFSPRFTPYWDQHANQVVATFYQKLLPADSHVLDLMAGVHSPLLQADISNMTVQCAGLIKQEMQHNPLCQTVTVCNVNDPAPLPYPDQTFDAVLIHAAIEYVIRPVELIADIYRILKPGGQLIISHSNRGEDAKITKIWCQLGDFERSGLLLSVTRHCGFTNLQGFSYDQHSIPDFESNMQLPSFPVWVTTAIRP